MDKKSRIAIIGSAVMVLIIVIVLGATIVEKLTPSKEVMLLTEYYKVKDKEVLVILQDKIYEKKGMLIDGAIYLDYETIAQNFNHRFYWDNNENILTFTTPTEIIQTEAGSSEYSITKSMIKTQESSDYPIVKVFANDVFLALEFVQKYSDMSFSYYENPSRVVINYLWGDYLYTEVSKDTQLRYNASIKSEVLLQLPVGTSLMYVDTDETPKKGFSKVMTNEGVIGYVKNKHVKESFDQTITSTYQQPEYTSIKKAKKMNLVFHQVFNTDATDNLVNLIGTTKGVTTVSPTWFSIDSVEGTFSSFASKSYVEKANGLGLEVWALIDDFSTEVSMFELLSYTSRRENLANALVEAAIEYKLNGINIDFEKISKETGEHYIQFLRELSVKCRNNGIVLSVDNFVPAPYTEHYDREEQGKILDYVIVMAYDEFYAGSEVAGPVASLGFVQDAIKNTIAIVPKEKTIIAVPFYTRLWKESKDGDISAESLAMTPASTLLKDNDAQTVWDKVTAYNYAEYKIDDVLYKMWQEDDRSIEEKLKIIYEADVAGIAAWKLGLEKESIWNLIAKYFN